MSTLCSFFRVCEKTERSPGIVSLIGRFRTGGGGARGPSSIYKGISLLRLDLRSLISSASGRRAGGPGSNPVAGHAKD